MTPRYRSPRAAAAGWPVDVVGLIAFAAAPAIALYQGLTAALRILVPIDDFLATLLPLVVIVGCLALRLTSLTKVLASPSVRRATLYLMIYLLVLLASTLMVFVDPLERDPSKMFEQYLSAAAAVLVFLVMITAPSLPGALRALALAIVVWAVAAVLTPLTALTPLPIGEVQGAFAGSQGVRSFGVLGDGGTFAVSFLAVAFFVSRRFVWLALALFALILSGSRMPLIVAGAGIASAVVLSNPTGSVVRPGGRAIRVVLASLAVTLLLLAVQLVFSAVSQRFGAFNAFERLSETQFTESDRFFSIAQGLEWVRLSPIYGHGFNAYYYFSLRSAAFGANQSNALNQVVQTLMDGGIVALAFLTLFFVEVIRPGNGTMIDRRRDPYGLRVWLLVFVVLNQTAVYILPASYLTILVFGACGIAVYAREAAAPAAARGVGAMHVLAKQRA